MKTTLVCLCLLVAVACTFSGAQSVGGPPPVVVTNPCGPPNYTCTTTSALTVQTPAAPFSSATLVNSIGYDTSLNASGAGITGIDPIARVTDQNTCSAGGCGGGNRSQHPTTNSSNESFAVSCAGMATSGDCTAATVYMLFIHDSGGCFSPIDFNITTMSVPHPQPVGALRFCSAEGLWSRTNSNLAYIVKANAGVPTLYSETFTGHNPTSAVEASVFAFSSCSGYPGGTFNFFAGFSVDNTDNRFLFSATNTGGGQDTQKFLFVYESGTGKCSIYNTSTGSVTSDSGFTGGATGTISTSCRANIHEVYISHNGTWAYWSTGGAPTGCPTGAPSHQFWKIGTLTDNPCLFSNGTTVCSGHAAIGNNAYFAMNSPNWHQIDPNNPVGTDKIVFSEPSSAPTHHNGWQNSTDDTQIVLVTTANVNGTWSNPYFNEAYGIWPSGATPKRFGHTFTSGQIAGLGFCAQNVCANVSPDGRLLFFASDMLLGLGTDSGGSPRYDVFAIRLD